MIKYLSLVVLLAGCASTIPVPQEVEVPVTVACKTPKVDAPVFGYPQNIAEGMALFDMTKILLSDINLHLGYEQLLRAAIAACAD